MNRLPTMLDTLLSGRKVEQTSARAREGGGL